MVSTAHASFYRRRGGVQYFVLVVLHQRLLAVLQGRTVFQRPDPADEPRSPQQLVESDDVVEGDQAPDLSSGGPDPCRRTGRQQQCRRKTPARVKTANDPTRRLRAHRNRLRPAETPGAGCSCT